MKNTVIKFFLILTIVSGIFTACGNPSGPIINETYSIPNFEWKKWQFYSPSNSEGTLIFEDFEGGSITSKNPWTHGMLAFPLTPKSDLIFQIKGTQIGPIHFFREKLLSFVYYQVKVEQLHL